MSQDMERENHIKSVAEETLDVFEAITNKADIELAKRQGNVGGASALIYANGITGGGKASKNMDSISSELTEDLYDLKKQPAFARIVVSNEEGQIQTYYVSRRSTIVFEHDAKLVSYLNPLGRLASLPVGEEEDIEHKGQIQSFEVLESSRYQPQREQRYWDSKPTIFRLDSGTFTVQSLRELLEESGEDADAILDAIFSDRSESAEILEGLRHQVRTAIALRDQPILDRFQDKIFRLPINSQLLIVGPPGTGKTTTLIRRLGQKLTLEALNSAERGLVIQSEADIRDHQHSWLMFTPTDLLKHFVKEAFNREQVSVSATDQNIKTWDTYRSDLTRNILGIMQTSGATNKFIYKNNSNFVSSEVQLNPVDWYESFKDFHRQRILSQLHQGIAILNKLINDENEQLIGQLKVITEKAKIETVLNVLSQLYQMEAALGEQIKQLKTESDQEIRKSLTLIINTEGRQFAEDLASFLASLQSSEEAEDEEEDEDNEFDNDTEEESEDPTSSTSQKKAIKTYERTLRSLARYKYQKRQPPKNGRTRKINDWLGVRLPTDEKLLEIGQSIATQNGLRRFVKVFNRYVNNVPASYKEFRKNALKNKSSQYLNKPKNNRHIDATELDAVTLLMLRNTRELLEQRFVINNIEQAAFNTLNIISQQFKNQILVDEATDFSPLQLAAMESLTSLKTRSFFACGDFNQRITRWGIRSQGQMEWVSRQVTTEAINTVYRQSQKLNEFAGMLLQQFDGDLSSRGKLPEEMNNEGLAPILMEGGQELDDVAIWLAGHLQEIDKITDIGQMPTVAVLVNSEAEVKPMAAALNEMVEDMNLRAVACSDGQSLGEGTDIRVFDVQHIKGLEFEAVFFIGVDTLAENNPELFSKYLYVGATRAATYFGISCKERLPENLEPLRDQFIPSWEMTQ